MIPGGGDGPCTHWNSQGWQQSGMYNRFRMIIYFSWERNFMYPPNLMSGKMLSHRKGRVKPIPEVIHLWSHKTSMPNNLEKSRLVCVLYTCISCTFIDRNEKNNQSPHWGRNKGILSWCPRFTTSTTRQASSWIASLGHLDGIPSSIPHVVLDSINLICTLSKASYFITLLNDQEFPHNLLVSDLPRPHLLECTWEYTANGV